MVKNQIITLTIDTISSDGNGIGRYDGIAVFVPFTVVGDICEVRIVKVLKTYAFGIVSAIQTPGSGRIDTDCRAFGRCGGCALRQLSYDAELAAKQGFVQDAFGKLGGFDLAVLPCVPSPETDHYRNKVQYPFTENADGSVGYGFYALRSHRVIPCKDCRLQPTVLGDIAAFICEELTAYGVSVYDEATKKGVLRHLYLRRGAHSGEIMVCLVVNANGISCENTLVDQLTTRWPEIKTIVINSNREDTNVVLGRRFRTIFGEGVIRDTLCGVPVALSAPSFYQVNTRGAEQLYAIAAQFADPSASDLLLDLYCGTGTIGLSMASKVHKLLGVEIVPQAVENAIENARQMGLTNTEFFCADAGETASKLAAEGVTPDIVVLDPPRKGCDDATLCAVLKMEPVRIVMVSCNAATAARDAKFLAANGYGLCKVQPVDMFPRTKHVECVCLLTKATAI